MVATTDPEQLERMWKVGRERKPLCNSFVCPCCGRLLPATDANTHMVTALSNIEPWLDEQSRRRFGASKQRGDLAARRAMREMLHVQIDTYKQTPNDGSPARVVIDDRWPLEPGTGMHWCGHPQMTRMELDAREEYRRFFIEKWAEVSNLAASSGGWLPQVPAFSLLPTVGASDSNALDMAPPPMFTAQGQLEFHGFGADTLSLGGAGPVDVLQRLRHFGEHPQMGDSSAAGGPAPGDAIGPSASAAGAGLQYAQRVVFGRGAETAASGSLGVAGSRAAAFHMLAQSTSAATTAAAASTHGSGMRVLEDGGDASGVSGEHVHATSGALTERVRLGMELPAHTLEDANRRKRHREEEEDEAADLGPHAARARLKVEGSAGGARHSSAAWAEEDGQPQQPQQHRLHERRPGPAHPSVELVEQVEVLGDLQMLPPQSALQQTAPVQQSTQQPFTLLLAPLGSSPPRPEQDEEAQPQVEVVQVQQRTAPAREPEQERQREGRLEQQVLPAPHAQQAAQPTEQAAQHAAQHAVEQTAQQATPQARCQADARDDTHQQCEARDDAWQPPRSAQQQAHTLGSRPAPQAPQQTQEQQLAGIEQQARPDRAPDRGPDQGADQGPRPQPGPMHSSLANALRQAARPAGLQQDRPWEGPQRLEAPKPQVQWEAQGPGQDQPLQQLLSEGGRRGLGLLGGLGDGDMEAAGLGRAGQPLALPPHPMLQAGNFGAGLGRDGTAVMPTERSSGGMERSVLSGSSARPEASPEPETALPKRRRPLQACPACKKILSHAQYYVHLADMKRHPKGQCRGADRAGVPQLRFGGGPAESAASQPPQEPAADSASRPEPSTATARTPLLAPTPAPAPAGSSMLLPPPLPPALPAPLLAPLPPPLLPSTLVPLPPQLPPPLLPPLPPPLPPPQLRGAEALGLMMGELPAGPGSLLPNRDSGMRLPPTGWMGSSGLLAPVLQDAPDGDVRCSICKIQEGGKNLERDHATSMGFLLCDLCGLEEALVSRTHTVDGMREEVKAMRTDTPYSELLLWQVGGKPLCCCFVCPCCKRLLPSGDANKHMVAALDAVFPLLSEPDQARFTDKLKTRGDLAARRAMREMLLERGDCTDVQRGLHYCGMPPMTAKERGGQQRYSEFLHRRWQLAMAVPGGRGDAALPSVLDPAMPDAAADDPMDPEQLMDMNGMPAPDMVWQPPPALVPRQLPLPLPLPPARNAAGAGGGRGGGLLAPAPLRADNHPEGGPLSYPASGRGAGGGAGPQEEPIMGLLPAGRMPFGLEAPGPHAAGALELVSECAVCGHSPNWRELQLGHWPPIDHLWAVGYILNDALRLPDLLQLAARDPDTAKKVVGAMCGPAAARPWQLGGEPLCCCFPCPCCERVLFHANAHRHMLAALLHSEVWRWLGPQARVRVRQIQQQQPLPEAGMLQELSPMACLKAMRGMLQGVIAAHPTVLNNVEEPCLCGAERMTKLEAATQQAALAGLKAAGSSLAVASEQPPGRPGGVAPAAPAAAAPASRGDQLVRLGRTSGAEAMDSASVQQQQLALQPPGMPPAGLHGRPGPPQPAARPGSQPGLPLAVGGGRLGLPQGGGAAATAPPLPASLLTGRAGQRLPQPQQKRADSDSQTSGALAWAGERPVRRAQQPYGDEEPYMRYDDGRAMSYGDERVEHPGVEAGQRGREPNLKALMDQLAAASASASQTAAPAGRAPAAVAASAAVSVAGPLRKPKPQAEEAGRAPPYGAELREAAPPAASAASGSASAGLQLVTALLKQLPPEQRQYVLREMEADADGAAAPAGAGGAAAAGAGAAGAGIPLYLAEQLAASGVDLSGLPPQPPRQQQQQQPQRQGRNVAAAAAAAAGPGPGPARGAPGAGGGRGLAGQRPWRQDRDAAEEDALSVLMTLRDQGGAAGDIRVAAAAVTGWVSAAATAIRATVDPALRHTADDDMLLSPPPPPSAAPEFPLSFADLAAATAEFRRIRRHLVITVMDKCPDHFVAVCPHLYHRHLVADLTASPFYTPVSPADYAARIRTVATMLQPIGLAIKPDRPPAVNYGTGKCHKTPFAFRYITASPSIATTDAAVVLTSFLRALDSSLPALYAHVMPAMPLRPWHHYLQIRGVAMGANFASYVANLALAYDEFRWQLALYDSIFRPATASLRAEAALAVDTLLAFLDTQRYTDDLLGGGNPFLPHLLMQSQSIAGISGIYSTDLKLAASGATAAAGTATPLSQLRHHAARQPHSGAYYVRPTAVR
ncbi:hypothetical protein HXX76_004291 [Chlamydomonas incerta]|uniref:Uncharacterized protein n=1 Tax=Chlamydomonas incerta TaxID=51695 RepID=A0A835TBL0_CHLIN|nr:hypothetical protein HXX76_004291 [Chlamydomonas incerta]|eukprot:KAG2440178.1 hypothetical protein HXX76_004291 [Chlamydomonas incerta]